MAGGLNVVPIFKLLTKTEIKIAGPLIVLLVGCQILMDLKFACPCTFVWNQVLSIFIFIVPPLFVFLIMLLFVMYNTEKSEAQDNCGMSKAQDNSGTSGAQGNSGTSGAQDNSGTSKAQDNSGTSGAQDNSGTSGAQDNSGTSKAQDNSGTSGALDNRGKSQSKEMKLNWYTVFICLVPSLMWICIALIDGDYIACVATFWNGHYVCDKELHPNCLNWCKPTELSPGTSETELYEKTRVAINGSKVAGYIMAFVLCIMSICLSFQHINEQKVSKDPTRSGEQQGLTEPSMSGEQGPTEPSVSGEQQVPTEPSMSGEQQGPTEPTIREGQQCQIDPQEEKHNDSYQLKDSENPTENDCLLKPKQPIFLNS